METRPGQPVIDEEELYRRIKVLLEEMGPSGTVAEALARDLARGLMPTIDALQGYKDYVRQLQELREQEWQHRLSIAVTLGSLAQDLQDPLRIPPDVRPPGPAPPT